MLFDSHCHLDDPRLFPHLGRLISEAGAVGITGFLVPGVAPEGWGTISTLSATFPQIYPAFGVHPMHADLLTPKAVSDLCRLAGTASAIGEIGLDYLIPSPSRQLQQQAFRTQLRIAAKAQLPVLLHCRKAFADLLYIMEEEGFCCGGVMHAFSGSLETARNCLRRGLHISLSGSVTYANARRPVEVAAEIPLDRLLLETDAPDLAPEPHRGSVNLPSYLLETASRVAQIRGMALGELGETTTGNAARLFRLKVNLPS
ncbi:Putative deoxyribonuclease YjjV [Citrifermentans bremense]|uniref:Deoxyribonuclease YjjV n=1 Tax=Citrifermentans bremense TaxID=60035 RepID=A0A6S6M418_9BACT|nr:TatD family hydrolase [Citrifermentans bremense]BCG49072.1 Putative deoxyribonuclease YjjV [Citrifermentans bremense]